MALVIEDGTGLPDSQSYATAADARAYAAARGLVLPQADADIEVLLIKAMDFVESFRARFQGTKTVATQALQWPRTDAQLDGIDIDPNTIPKLLKDAQSQLAFEASQQDLMPTGTGKEVVSEQVDTIAVRYSEQGNGNPQPIFTKAEAMLLPLLTTSSSGGGLSTLRL